MRSSKLIIWGISGFIEGRSGLWQPFSKQTTHEFGQAKASDQGYGVPKHKSETTKRLGQKLSPQSRPEK